MIERAMLEKLAERTDYYNRMFETRLANEIANQLAKRFG